MCMTPTLIIKNTIFNYTIKLFIIKKLKWVTLRLSRIKLTLKECKLSQKEEDKVKLITMLEED